MNPDAFCGWPWEYGGASAPLGRGCRQLRRLPGVLNAVVSQLLRKELRGRSVVLQSKCKQLNFKMRQCSAHEKIRKFCIMWLHSGEFEQQTGLILPEDLFVASPAFKGSSHKNKLSNSILATCTTGICHHDNTSPTWHSMLEAKTRIHLLCTLCFLLQLAFVEE